MEFTSIERSFIKTLVAQPSVSLRPFNITTKKKRNETIGRIPIVSFEDSGFI